MSEILHEVLETPVVGACDVLVAGAGPAGVSAAVCAARLGAKTCLVEQTGMVGGVSTSGLMSHWTGETRGGIYEEILDRSKDSDDPALRRTIHPDRLQDAYLAMLSEAGAALRLHTFVSAPLMEDGRVAGIVAESKSGRQALRAKVVVDASGDGDVAARAGAAFELGRAGDHAMQPMTLMFKLGGVDTDRAIFPQAFEHCIEVPAGEIQALGKAELPSPAGHVLLYRSTLPGVVTVNMTNLTRVDGTKAEDLTRAQIACHGQIGPIVDFLRRRAPGYEKCFVISSAAQVGVRETRHFKGVSTITEEDILAARVFPDWVVTKAHFNFDIHNVEGAGLDAHGSQATFTQRKGYTIPYGCLVPEALDGLLLAGRSISGTHKACSNFRAMPICANVGQAAGVAAALAARAGVQPRAVPVADIQAELRRQGVEP